MPPVTPPEQGQLVEVRQRRYVVTDVRQSTLPPEPLAQADATPQHRVTLASVEDDALGEELQVIWEIELKRAIEAGLREPTATQLLLPTCSGSEREQFERNMASVRTRVAQIPAEIAAETAAIQARYAEEVAQGLHDKGAKRADGSGPRGRPRKKPESQGELF